MRAITSISGTIFYVICVLNASSIGYLLCSDISHDAESDMIINYLSLLPNFPSCIAAGGGKFIRQRNKVVKSKDFSVGSSRLHRSVKNGLI